MNNADSTDFVMNVTTLTNGRYFAFALSIDDKMVK